MSDWPSAFPVYPNAKLLPLKDSPPDSPNRLWTSEDDPGVIVGFYEANLTGRFKLTGSEASKLVTVMRFLDTRKVLPAGKLTITHSRPPLVLLLFDGTQGMQSRLISRQVGHSYRPEPTSKDRDC
jgi:hypothetical protein